MRPISALKLALSRADVAGSMCGSVENFDEVGFPKLVSDSDTKKIPHNRGFRSRRSSSSIQHFSKLRLAMDQSKCFFLPGVSGSRARPHLSSFGFPQLLQPCDCITDACLQERRFLDKFSSTIAHNLAHMFRY